MERGKGTAWLASGGSFPSYQRRVMKERICVVGAGRSGAVAAACLAELGHRVCAVDLDVASVAQLREGRAPFSEPGLDELIERNLRAGRLSFATALSEGVPAAHFVLLSVGTPAQGNGEADLSALHAAVRELAPLLAEKALVVTRSTVPVGTNASLADDIRAQNPQAAFDVVANPEFLREGHAVEDFLRPERIVIGARSAEAAQAVARLYDGIDGPVVITDLETAEMIKYAANAYLAASISFINEIANICERVGADVSQVARALALDRRIGEHAYLKAGIGFGGSCLPKDLRALIATAERHQYQPAMLRAIAQVNELQPRRLLARVREVLGELAGLRIAVLGISFKGDTFDPRSSPALALIQLLAQEGARLRTFDPLADETVKDAVGSLAELLPDAYRAAEGCRAVIVATDHSQFRELDLERLGQGMAARVLIDGRNLYDPDVVARAGFSYVGIGRPWRAD